MKSAIISAIVAAIIAGGGSAYATTQLSGLAIAKHSIPANRLTARANKAYTATPKPRALAGAVNSTLDYEQATFPITADSEQQPFVVSCPAGDVAIGGGYTVADVGTSGGATSNSNTDDHTGWEVTGSWSILTEQGYSSRITVYVSCEPSA